MSRSCNRWRGIDVQQIELHSKGTSASPFCTSPRKHERSESNSLGTACTGMTANPAGKFKVLPPIPWGACEAACSRLPWARRRHDHHNHSGQGARETQKSWARPTHEIGTVRITCVNKDA